MLLFYLFFQTNTVQSRILASMSRRCCYPPLSESQKQQEQWENGPQCDPNLAIPLLMQNQVPRGFEDGDHVKVDLRPESVSQDGQENIEAIKPKDIQFLGKRSE